MIRIFLNSGQGITKMSLLFILVHQEAEKKAKRKSELFFETPCIYIQTKSSYFSFKGDKKSERCIEV